MNNQPWRFVTAALATTALACTLQFGAEASSNTFLTEAVIHLSPTGGDDTTMIQSVLDSAACHLPNECTVRLAPGEYRIGLLYTSGFNGKLEGAGKGRTILSALPELDTTNADLFLPPGKDNHLPHLIIFDNGNLEIRDLTIQATEETPTKGWGIPAFGFSANYLISLLNITGVTTNSRLERVAIKGVLKPDSVFSNGYNVLNGTFHQTMPIFGVDAISRLGGQHVVSDCDFDTVSQGSSVFGLENSTITFGGRPGKGNRYENVHAAYDIAGNFASSVTISHNQITSACMGLTLYESGLWSSAALLPASYDILQNQIRIRPTGPVSGGCGVGLSLSGGRAVGGSSKVGSNVVVGSGVAAIVVDGDVADILLSNDHVQGFLPDIAHIWLGPQTLNIRVIGVTPSVIVKDEGTGNLITNK